jgi:hypothetical protein
MSSHEQRIADQLVLERYARLPVGGRKTVAEAARALRMPRKTLAELLVRNENRVQPATEEEADALVRANARIKFLEKELLATKDRGLSEAIVRAQILKLAEVDYRMPDWVVEEPRKRSKNPGIPSLLLSDLHWGEVVKKEQVNGVNEYNLEIANRRLKRVFERTIHLLRHYMTPSTYEGMVLSLSGDLVSGDIHDELTETNEMPIMPCVIDLVESLAWGISVLADEFGKLFIVCVPGNHGRNTKKPRAKNRCHTSFDWLICSLLERRFAKDERIKFLVSPGADAYYRVYHHRYLNTHGDQFRGGDGMIGHIGPVTRGRHKKLSRDAAIDRPWDTMTHGHYHTYKPGDQIIGNGSLIGANEYSMIENFGIEPPRQALWLTHPRHGITYHIPVVAEENKNKGGVQPDWVSWK